MGYSEMAAGRAMSVFDYGEASRLLEQALQVQEVLDPDDKIKRCDLLLALGEALMPAGDPQRVFEAVAPEALALAEALDDHERASQTCYVALRALTRYGSSTMSRTPEFRQWAERADRYAAPETIHRVNADMALGTAAVSTGRFTEGRSLLENALELVREMDDPDTLFNIAYLLLIYSAPQHEDERYLLVEEITNKARPVGEQVGHKILGTWINAAKTVFIWIRTYDSEDDAKSKDEAFFNSPAWQAISSEAAEFIAKTEVTPMTSPVPPT